MWNATGITMSMALGRRSPPPRGGRRAEPVDIVMPVALDMGDAEHGRERGVLLHAQAGLAGQILAR